MLFIVPKKMQKITLQQFITNLQKHLPYLLIIFTVVAVHLIEVNFIDSHTTALIGVDFADAFQSIEGDIVYSFSQYWSAPLLVFFVLMYIAVYPFTLWFTPLYLISTDNKKAMKTLAYGLLITYKIALLFYLFLPVTNVYTYYGGSSALNQIIPGVEQFFYSTTTHNNCFPSLHVAMTLLLARTVQLTGNKKYTYFAYFCAISVIIAVIYLSIHWLLDVFAGLLITVGVILLLKHFIKE